MPAKIVRLKHSDRAVNTITGETGTVVDQHDGGSGKKGATKKWHYGILLDHGPRMLVVWEEEVTERTGGPVRGCKRCGSSEHVAVTCDKGDIP